MISIQSKMTLYEILQNFRKFNHIWVPVCKIKLITQYFFYIFLCTNVPSFMLFVIFVVNNKIKIAHVESKKNGQDPIK